MATILENIKIYCEVDDTDEFDQQLLNHANEVLGYVYANGIPVVLIDENSDSTNFINLNPFQMNTLQALINLHCYRTFDKLAMEASATSQSWVDLKMLDLLHQLKVQFDVDDFGAPGDSWFSIDDIVNKVTEQILENPIHMEDV